MKFKIINFKTNKTEFILSSLLIGTVSQLVLGHCLRAGRRLWLLCVSVKKALARFSRAVALFTRPLLSRGCCCCHISCIPVGLALQSSAPVSAARRSNGIGTVVVVIFLVVCFAPHHLLWRHLLSSSDSVSV